MGATVTVGKRALALRGDNGAIYYTLLENRYEKNVYPHKPHWSAVAYGTIEEVMDKIFLRAAGTEDGLLQGRNGWLAPPAYVAGWLRALANPLPLRQGPTKDIRGELTAEKVHAVRAAGYPDLAGRLQADLEDKRGIVLDFQTSPNEIAVLVKHAGLPAWTLIDPRTAYHEGDSSYPRLGYRPRPGRAKDLPLSPKGFLVNLAGDGASKNVVIRKSDGSLELGRALWREKERFIEGYARHELSYPGRFAESWARFRDHLASFPDLPEDTIVRVDPSHANEWVREEAQELAGRIGPDGVRLGNLPEKDRRLIGSCPEVVALAAGLQMQSPLEGGQHGFGGRTAHRDTHRRRRLTVPQPPTRLRITSPGRQTP